MKIDELLDKYFEGETSCEDERELRRFFTGENVPEHLELYRPLFSYLAQEAETEKKCVQRMHSHGKHTRLNRIFYLGGSIAAGVLLLIGIARISFPATSPENYVIIDGKCYTDKHLAESKALEALQYAGFTEKELNDLLFQHQ